MVTQAILARPVHTPHIRLKIRVDLSITGVVTRPRPCQRARWATHRESMAEYRGRAEVMDGRGRRVDDVQVTVRGAVHHSAARGVVSPETLVGWRRFRLS